MLDGSGYAGLIRKIAPWKIRDRPLGIPFPLISNYLDEKSLHVTVNVRNACQVRFVCYQVVESCVQLHSET